MEIRPFCVLEHIKFNIHDELFFKILFIFVVDYSLLKIQPNEETNFYINRNFHDFWGGGGIISFKKTVNL